MELPSSIGGTSWGIGCPETNGVRSGGSLWRSGGQITSGEEGQQQGAVLGSRGSGVEEKFVRNFPPRSPLYSEQLLRPDNPAPERADNPALLGADNPACRHHFSEVSKRTLVCILERWF